MKKNFLYYILLAAVACSCNNREEDPSVGTLTGHYIGFGDVAVDVPVTTKAAAGMAAESEVVMSAPNFSLSGSVTVGLIGDGLETKAEYPVPGSIPGEITRDNLSGFYVDGFLDASNQHVTEDAHFIKSAPTTYDPDATSSNRDIKGRWFFTPKDAYQWRNRILHYFWAYSSFGGNMAATKDKLEFDFDTDNMTKDLVIARHEQYWDDRHVTDAGASTTYHDSEDELRILPFKHAVSAVALKNSIEFKKFNKENPAAPVNGKYSDADLADNTKDEDETTPRLELIYAGLQGFTSGHVTAEGGDFAWSNLGGYKKSTSAAVGEVTSAFMVPQRVNTSSDYNENAIAVFTIRDNKLTKTQDFPIRLPRFTAGDADEYWMAGNYYKYNYNGRFIAPYVPYGQEDGYPANFAGQPNEINIPFDPIDMTYIHHINLTWEILPQCQSNGLQIYIFISPTPIEYVNERYKQTTIYYNRMINPADFNHGSYDSSTMWLLHFSGKGNVITVEDIKAGQTVLYNGETVTEGYVINPSGSATSEDLKGTLSFPNIDVSGLTGKNYVYIGYDGGNNSDQCLWIMKNVSLEIVD